MTDKNTTNTSTTLEPWIETFSGKQFYFLDPTLDSIDIRDIAHSLAFTCRYTGHSRRFYSVAEHSILVSYLASDPLAGLLHDASEAYITDIASPIKPYLQNYKELEDKLMGKIAEKFGFTYPLTPDIKDCDATQLKTEAKHLLRSGGYPWAHLYPTKRPHGITPNCWSPEEAEAKFLERFEEVRTDHVEPSFDWPYFLGIPNSIDHLARAPSWDERFYRFKSTQLDGGLLREANYGRQGNHCGEDGRSEDLGPRVIEGSFTKAT